jgi:hypothetical protein
MRQPSLRPLAVIRDYDQQVDVFRARADALGVTYETIDEVAGLPTRYTTKLMGPMRVKTLGKHSFGPLCGAFGIAFIAVVDDEAFRRVEHRLLKRRYARRRPA